MGKALLLESSRRGYFRITDRGREILKNPPQKLNNEFLTKFPEFMKFRKDSRTAATRFGQDEAEVGVPEDPKAIPPNEALEGAYKAIREELVGDLLTKIGSAKAEFFEQLVLDVLVSMGYGGSRADAAKRLGRSGDEGVDGVIREDHLGLDLIYVQAKKWNPQQTVSRPEVQKFVGALHGKRCRKGVFITTSRYTKEAREYAESLEDKVILVDGTELANLMIDFDIGVNPIPEYKDYKFKRLDSDYFPEE
jgi:restriction system protein